MILSCQIYTVHGRRKNTQQAQAVAQEVEQVIYLLEGHWFNPRLLQSASRGVLGQDTEPQITPVAVPSV